MEHKRQTSSRVVREYFNLGRSRRADEKRFLFNEGTATRVARESLIFLILILHFVLGELARRSVISFSEILGASVIIRVVLNFSPFFKDATLDMADNIYRSD